MKSSLRFLLFKGIIKSTLSLFLLTFVVSQASAQVVTIPADSSSDGSRQEPYGSPSPYSRGHYIYTAAEIGAGANITTISFFLNDVNNAADSTPIVIKLKNSQNTTVKGQLYADATVGFTTVYTGSIIADSLTDGSWVTVTLPVPFTYAGQNLEVITEVNFGTLDPDNWGAKDFAWKEMGSDMTELWRFEDLTPASDYPGDMYSNRPVIRFNKVPAAAMAYVSAIAKQINGTSFAGATDQAVLGLEVHTTGLTAPLDLTQLQFNTAGSSLTAGLIQNAKVFYTGIDPEFKASNQFGSTVSTPSGAFSVTGSQVLAHGINYFWLTYDIGTAGITTTDSVDAVFSLVTVAGADSVPLITNPAGSMAIGYLYDFEAATDQDFSAISLGTKSNQWERGMPDPFANPSSAYSGVNCWGTNLAGSYEAATEYALHTPQYITLASSLNISFQEYYFIGNDATATFEYKVNSNPTWTRINRIQGYVTNDKWKNVFYVLPVDSGDTIQFRWRLETAVNSSPSDGWYIDDFLVSKVKTFNQAYKTSRITTIEEATYAGAKNQGILKIAVEMAGTESPLELTSINLNTNGSATGIVAAARLYYTGSTDQFGTQNQFGTDATAPSGSFSFAGTQPLTNGINYFWLTYDIDTNAQVGDALDAEVSDFTISASVHNPADSAPAGALLVGYLYDFDTPGTQGFAALTLNENPNQWEKGTPATGPGSAYSGTDCWGTNLNGDFGKKSDYELLTLPYVAESNVAEIRYQQWYNFNFASNEIDATFEYQVNNNNTWLPVAEVDNDIWENSGNKWEQVIARATAHVAGDTIQFRWRFKCGQNTYTADGWYIDDFIVSGVRKFDQRYSRSYALSVAGLTEPGIKAQTVIKVAVEMSGTENPLQATKLDFNTNGSTISALDAAKVYYTGTNNFLETTNQFGSTITSPSGLISFTGTQEMATGINYFWLVYDIAAGAVIGDSVDAECTLVEVGGINQVPLVTAPAGNVIVAKVYDFDGTSDESFTTSSLTSKPLRWERNTPGTGAGAPLAAYSGANCWASNRNKVNNMQEANFYLTTPAFVATSPNVTLNYKEWIALTSNYDVELNVEMQVNGGTWTTLKQVRTPQRLRSTDWEDVLLTTGGSTNVNDTFRIRWRYLAPFINSTNECWYIDHFRISGARTFDQIYVSNELTQKDLISNAGFRNQEVLRIEIKTKGADNALPVTGIELTTNGTTPGAIEAAKIYYTADRPTFDATTLFGTPAIAPATGFTITGSQALSEGSNYFWVVYDVATGALAGDSLDAGCTMLHIAGNTIVPDVTEPAGSVLVGELFDFDGNSDQNFVTENYSTDNNNKWKRGTPTYGPSAAYSAPNCWGSNLDGSNEQYPSGMVNNALITPPFLVNNSRIAISYKQWFDGRYSFNPSVVTFEYKNGTAGAWTNISTIDITVMTTTNNAWMGVDEVLASAAAVGDTIWLRWKTDGVYPGTDINGWFIDNLVTSGLEMLDIVPPVIEYTPLSHTAAVPQRTLTDFATITDAGSINVSGFNPRIYYKKSSEADLFGGNTSSANGWKYSESGSAGSPFSFTIDHSLLTSALSEGDTIQYFVVAQDENVTPNVASNPSEGFSATSVSGINTSPVKPQYYIITGAPLTGVYTVGTGMDYTTLTAATTDLNMRGVSGAVTFSLTDAAYNMASGEAFPLTITPVRGGSVANTVTIKPAAGNDVTISANGNAIFRFAGANNVTIDGSNNGTSSRNLTLTDTLTPAMIWLHADAIYGGSHHIAVRNVNMPGNQSVNYGIYAGNSSSPSATAADAPNSDNNIENNFISGTQYAVYITGTGDANNADQNNTVKGNLIGDSTSAVTIAGVYMKNQVNALISANTVRNVNYNSASFNASDVAGIHLSGSRNSQITLNKVYNWKSNAGYSNLAGIAVRNTNTTTNNTVANNFVADGHGTGDNVNKVSGIWVSSGRGDMVYHNTVNLTGELVKSEYGKAAALNMEVNNAAGDVRNNLLNVNGTSINAANIYAYIYNGSNASFVSDYNVMSCVAGGAAIGWIGNVQYVDVATLADWQANSGKDANSRTYVAQFVSAIDLHVAGSSIGDSANLAGVAIPTLATDIDGETRANPPYIGADENTGAPLPVKLLAFTASVKHTDVLLQWSTSSESNNKGFDVERSFDNKSFSKIGFVKGSGNSSSVKAYSHNDEAAFLSFSGTIYYRLKQVDNNGAFEYSKTISVGKDKQAALAVSAYPNPFAAELHVQVDLENAAAVKVSITDMTGKLVSSGSYEAIKGTNLLDLSSTIGNVKDAGVYFLIIDTGNQKHIQKLIRQ